MFKTLLKKIKASLQDKARNKRMFYYANLLITKQTGGN
jgi:hypothetical protein